MRPTCPLLPACSSYPTLKPYTCQLFEPYASFLCRLSPLSSAPPYRDQQSVRENFPTVFNYRSLRADRHEVVVCVFVREWGNQSLARLRKNACSSPLTMPMNLCAWPGLLRTSLAWQSRESKSR